MTMPNPVRVANHTGGPVTGRFPPAGGAVLVVGGVLALAGGVVGALLDGAGLAEWLGREEWDRLGVGYAVWLGGVCDGPGCGQ